MTAAAAVFGRPRVELPGVGDMELGFYGFVQPADFVKASEIPFDRPTGYSILPDADSVPWMKFAYRGKVLYVAQKALYSNVAWNAWNSLGMVFGSHEITLGGKQYKVRLLAGGPLADVPANSGYNEWEDLLYPMNNGTWASLPPSQFGFTTARNGYWNHTQSSLSISNILSAGGTTMSGRGSTPKSNLNQMYGHRPVLELIS